MSLPGAPRPTSMFVAWRERSFHIVLSAPVAPIFFRVKQKNSCQSRRIRLQKAIIAKNRYNQLTPLPDGMLDSSGGFIKSCAHAIRKILQVEESSRIVAARVAAKIHTKGNIR